MADMRRTLRPVQYTRMIENKFTSTENPFISLEAWDQCVDKELSPVLKDRALPILVGLDASTKHDDTAVIAVTWDDDAQKVRIVTHRVFTPTKADPINFEAVENVVLDLARRFRLVKLVFDPHQFASSSQRLTRAGIKVEEFTQTSDHLTAASQNLYELVTGRNLIAYPDKALRLAVSRAVAKETSRGWRIIKEKQSHKIDLAVALAMACHAAVEGQSAPQHPQFSPGDGDIVRARGAAQRMGFAAGASCGEQAYGERK
jgi:phage terminase large subunit-like protein